MIRILAVPVLLAAWGLVLESRNRLRKHGWHRLAYRWLTGLAWHGQAVSEDKWLWPGSWFWRMQRVKRAAIRCTVSATMLSLPSWPLYALLSAAAGVLAAAAVLLVRAVVTWRHRRRFVRPLHLAAQDIAGVGKSQSPSSWVSVARDRSKVALKLPQDWVPNAVDQKELVAIVVAKTGIEGDATWRTAGPAPMLTITASKPPPARVLLADVRHAITAAKPDELVWGLGRHSVVVKSSLSGDSPHLGLSMGSGAGKSVTARVLLAQQLFHGAIGLVLDYKMISHQWARDLPNVAIVRRPHEIHEALLWLGREAERRNEVALHGADMDGNVHAVVGPRLLIVCEELNATVSVLRAYWRQLRNDDKGLPQRSPALDALDLVNFMGRQILMNLVYMGQRLSVKAAGGDGDARESIGVLAFGRYSPSNWKMLAPDFAMPPKSLTPGRIQVVSDRVQEVQAVFLPANEARELALAGVVTPCPAGMPGALRVAGPAVVSISGADAVLSQANGTNRRPVSGLVTLSEAVDERLVNRKLHAIRKASQRPGFPQPKGLRGTARVYQAIDLVAWDEN